MADFKQNYFQRRTKDRGPKSNNRISSPEVQVIGSDGQNLGIGNTADNSIDKVIGQIYKNGSGITGADTYMGGLETRMAGVITELNKNEIQIPSQFQNDPMAMAKWYGGEIAEFSKEWKKKNPDYTTPDFVDSQGNEYVNVLDPQNQINLATNRMKDLDLKNWSMKQPDKVLFGAINLPIILVSL